jgi:hypothetical protein
MVEEYFVTSIKHLNVLIICAISENEILWSIRKIFQFNKILLGRYYKVILSHNNGIEFTWEKIKQGVQEGSILGSILAYYA